MIPFLGAYYGDISVVGAEHFKKNTPDPDRIEKRWLETIKIFGIIEKGDFLLLINNETEWVKTFLEFSKGA